MSSVSLADSNSCPLNHQYHYIQYPGYYEHITQQQQQQQQHHNHNHHHHQHVQQQQQQHHPPTQAYAYCNCPCSCGNIALGTGGGGGGGVGDGGGRIRATESSSSTAANGCHHAPQSSVDSQMAVAVIVHRGGSAGDTGGGGGAGGGGGMSNKQSQSEQSLLSHSYQALQQLTPSVSSTNILVGDEHKPLNVPGNSKLNISCDCDVECTCAANITNNNTTTTTTTNATATAMATATKGTAAAAAAAAAAAQKRGALHDAMLAADEITVSESDNNSTMKKRGRGGGGNTRNSKKFNSWCVHNDAVGTPLPEKRCDAHYHHHHHHHHLHHGHHHHHHDSHLDIYCDGDEADGLDVCLKAGAAAGNGVEGIIIGGDDGGDSAAVTDASDHRPPLPPRPPPRPRTQTINSNGHRGGSGPGSVGLKKYVIWCLICGGFSCLLGVLFLGVYFLLHSYTITVGNFETVPTFVPATLLILTGLCIMSLARRRNRYSYLIKLSGACGLISALTCALVTVTTTVLHMSRLQALRECEYAQKTRTCTCYSNMIDSQVDHVDKEGVRLVFDSLSDCGVVHGSLYSCLRAIFGLSVAGVLIAVFSCMLVYQLLSHERKKMYWEQLELRCRSLYTSQQGPPPSVAAMAGSARGMCRCCEQCHAHRQSGIVYPWDDGAGEPPRFWTGQPPGNFYSPNPCADELHMAGMAGSGMGGAGGGGGGVMGGGCRGSHRGMPPNNARARTTSGWSWPRSWPWQRNSPGGNGSGGASGGGSGGNGSAGGNGSTRFRQTPSSPDSQYGFSNSLTVDGVHTAVPEESAVTAAAPTHALQQPFSVMPPSALPYGVWGPPPPYSDPNSPARRGYYQYVQPPTGACGAASNNLNAPQGERSLMGGLEHHHHHHAGVQSTQSQVPQPQQVQPQLQPQHLPCLNHRAAFLDAPGNAASCCGVQPPPNARSTTIKHLNGGNGGVGGGVDIDDDNKKDVSVGEYENTHSDSDGCGGGGGRDGGNGVRDRFSNTLPSRKLKKRVEAGVKSIGPNSHVVERVNVQQVFANSGSCGGGGVGVVAGGHYNNNNNNNNSSDMEVDESSAEQLVTKLSLRHKRNNINNNNNASSNNILINTNNNNNNNSKQIICGNGMSGGDRKDTSTDPAESEVYFADVSSCCNISVKNDNYYDDPNNAHQAATLQQLHHCHGHAHGHGHAHSHSGQASLRTAGGTTPTTVNGISTAHHQHQGSNCSSHGSSSIHNNNNNNNNNTSNSSCNEDYLAQRFGQRENSIRSRLPFPQPRSDEDDYERGGGQRSGGGNGSSGMPKDISRQSMCSSADSEPQTEFTDLSPATPCGNKFTQLHFAAVPAGSNGKSTAMNHGTSPTNFVASFPPYSSEQQSLEAHRRSTKNIHELLIPTDTPHYEVINDQFPLTPNSATNTNATTVAAAAATTRAHQKSMTQRHTKRSNEMTSTPHKVKSKVTREQHVISNGGGDAVAVAVAESMVWSTENVGGGGGGGGGGGDRMRL